MPVESEIDELARLIWYGWDDEHSDETTLDEINCAARRLHAVGYRKLDIDLLRQWAEDFETAAHEVPMRTMTASLVTRPNQP